MLSVMGSAGFDCPEFVPVICTVYVPGGVVAAVEVMVAVTLGPAALADGVGLLRLHAAPVGASTITQVSATGPVNPFKPFTTTVSVMFVPTLVAMAAVFRVTEKSFTASVTLAERTTPMPELVPMMGTVTFAAKATPK